MKTMKVRLTVDRHANVSPLIRAERVGDDEILGTADHPRSRIVRLTCLLIERDYICIGFALHHDGWKIAEIGGLDQTVAWRDGLLIQRAELDGTEE